MSAQDGPPQGMETKNVPGYVPAPTVNPDHPGHGDFAGTAGYTNTPGILDPESSSEENKPAPKKSGSATTKATPEKTSS
jgi:hypothetical protein